MAGDDGSGGVVVIVEERCRKINTSLRAAAQGTVSVAVVVLGTVL